MKINFTISAAIALLFFSSCATLTKSQLELVNKMSITSDSVSVAPALIFQDLAQVRSERGLFFASTLSTTEAHLQEVNAIAKGVQDDAAFVAKANVYVNVLNSYLRALRSLSSTARWEDIGREVRSLGRGVDSLLIAYNALEWSPEIETGYGVALGKAVGFISQEYMKRRQADAVKEFATRGDSLVAECCEALSVLLKKEEVNKLIINEEEGLEANYKSYLEALKLRGESASVSDDRHYVELKGELSSAVKMRTQCVSALKSLKYAHHKVVTELQKPKQINEIYEEVIELNAQALQLRKFINSK